MDNCQHCFEKQKNCVCRFYNCCICKNQFPESMIYEHRGVYACEEHIDIARGAREAQRQEIIDEVNLGRESEKETRYREGKL